MGCRKRDSHLLRCRRWSRNMVQLPKTELFEACRLNVLNGRSDMEGLLFDWADEKAKRQLQKLKSTLFFSHEMIYKVIYEMI